MAKIVLVLGCHRSGTSAVASALSKIGVNLGDRLLGTGRGNDLGHFEDLDVLNLNQRILARLGSAWDLVGPLDLDLSVAREFELAARTLLDSKVARFQPFGLKEPRLCRLLPFWRAIMDRHDTATVFVVRNPLAVAESLLARDDIGPERALNLWLVYTVEAWMGAPHPMIVVDYDRFLDDPLHELQTICHRLRLNLPFPGLGRNDLAVPGARHHLRSFDDLATSPVASPGVVATYKALLAAANGGDLRETHARIAAVAGEIAKNTDYFRNIDAVAIRARSAARMVAGSRATFSPRWTP